MALTDEVQARVSSALLVQLTNPDDKTATTVNTTILGYAATDTEGDFLSYGVTLDLTDKSHVPVAVDGVLYQLQRYKGGPESEKLRARFHSGLERLEAVGPRSHVIPRTNSQLTPSDEIPAGYTGEVRPDFDDEHLSGWVPRPPQGSGPGVWPNYGA